jgi:hypothetical protein
MARQLSLRPRTIAAAIINRLERPMTAPRRTVSVGSTDIWPLYEVPRPDGASPFAGDSGRIIADMVSTLSASQHGSTSEALAFLRQIYPGYPLTLRLAALVAHSKAPRAVEEHLADAAL